MQAYQWLQVQSPNVKELATSPDVLVSLYFKAKSQGVEFLEKPSIQNFKDELKQLAGKIGEFDGKSGIGAAASKPASAPSAQTTQSSQVLTQPSSTVAQKTTETSIDQTSRMMISEIKAIFNLSSDAEALRLVISTGFHKLKTFIANGNS